MNLTLKVVFGKEQVIKIYNNEILSEEERNLNLKEYQFESENEKRAFMYGLNESVGWMDICILEQEIV